MTSTDQPSAVRYRSPTGPYCPGLGAFTRVRVLRMWMLTAGIREQDAEAGAT